MLLKVNNKFLNRLLSCNLLGRICLSHRRDWSIGAIRVKFSAYFVITKNRAHLFFKCSFSYKILNFCMLRCRIEIPHVIWDDIV
jgi:hypothetical protein